jgi:hypothetical protein
MAIPMMNTWCSKHVEDAKKLIKTLIWKVCILLVYVTQLHHNARHKKKFKQNQKINDNHNHFEWIMKNVSSWWFRKSIVKKALLKNETGTVKCYVQTQLLNTRIIPLFNSTYYLHSFI